LRVFVHISILSAVIILCLFSSVFAYSGGSGEPNSPYQIGTVSDWQQLMSTSADWTKYFIMTADVNLYGVTLTPVGNSTTNFTGVFDGNGHIIHNAVINQPSSSTIGLFGYVSSRGKIRNLGVENVNITGNSQVGGLVGNNNYESSITACYAIGSVSGTNYVGGLVGNNSGTITACYATSSVSGTNYVGGLVGCEANNGTLSVCYATGSVSGTGDYVGGLVGANWNSIIFYCYWDTQTSGQPRSHIGGVGLPTATMQGSEIYLRAFWDFKGEIKNGVNDTWAMPQGGGYPVLAWQLGDSPVSNDEMSNAIAVTVGSTVSGTSIGATGLDITRNSYNDSADVWYYFDCASTGKYTITVEPENFNSTVAVFDGTQTEIVFNDDFFGEKSVVILNAATGQRYYIRVAGYNSQTGNFTLAAKQGAIHAIQGDLNYDGVVNLVDFSIFAENWMIE